MSVAPSNHAGPADYGRWSTTSQFAALGIVMAFAFGLIAFLERQRPEQIVVSGPVTFTSNELPPGVEIQLGDEASAGFARLISSGNDKVDGEFLEAAKPYGTFHVQGRSFDWHYSAFISDTHNQTRPRVWHSQVLATMYRSLSRVIEESKVVSKLDKIDDEWEPDLSGFVIQPLENQIGDRNERVRSAWEADLSGFADQP